MGRIRCIVYSGGELGEIREEVRRVVEYWAESYNGRHRIYCGYMDGKVVSFCLVEDKGVHNINGRELNYT